MTPKCLVIVTAVVLLGGCDGSDNGTPATATATATAMATATVTNSATLTASVTLTPTPIATRVPTATRIREGECPPDQGPCMGPCVQFGVQGSCHRSFNVCRCVLPTFTATPMRSPCPQWTPTNI